MRILIVHKHDQIFGGADTYALRLGAALESAGHEVRYLTSSLGEPHLPGETLKATTSHATRDASRPHEALGIAAAALWNRKAAAAARRLVDEFKPDVAHLHKIYPQLSASAVVTLDRLGVPLVQTIYDYEFLGANPHDPSGGRIDRIEVRASYRALNTALYQVKRKAHIPRVAKWNAVSDFVAAKHRDIGIDAEPISILMAADRPPTGSEPQRSGAVFVGRLVEQKGVLDLLEASIRRPDLDLTIVGSGPLEARVQDASARSPKLQFLPAASHEAVLGLLQASSVCLIPSRWEEPLGLILGEAMAAGTPTVVYDVGGLGPGAKAAGCGAVIEPGVDRLIEAWAGLIGDQEAQEQYRRAGLAHIDTEGSIERHLRTIEATYQSAIAS